MFNYATQPQSIGRVLDNGIRLCLTSFPAIVLFAFLAAFITGLPAFFAPPPPQSGEAVEVSQVISKTLLPSLLAMLAGFVFMNAMMVRIDATAHARSIGVGTSLGIGIRKLLPVFVGMVVYMVAVMLGMVLLVIPGVILMLSLAFYQMLIVVDGNRTFASLRASHRLVWGNWWRTATVFLVPAVLYLVIYVVLVLVLGMVIPFTDGEGGRTTLEFAINVMTIGVGTFSMPLFYSVALAQLNDLKLRKQGLDLEARIGSG
jgi:hypothetical protein